MNQSAIIPKNSSLKEYFKTNIIKGNRINIKKKKKFIFNYET